MPNQIKFDLSFCPEMYWDTQVCFLANVTGTIRRQLLELAIADENAPDAVFEVFSDKQKAAKVLPLLGYTGPSVRSGEDLPPVQSNETEIARVWTPTTVHAEVTSVRARSDGTSIFYMVVDEYWTEGYSYRISPESSTKPLTMEQLIQLIDTADLYFDDERAGKKGLVLPLWEQAFESECRRGLCADSADSVRSFVAVQSYFYPQLAAWYSRRFDQWASGKLWPTKEAKVKR